MTFLDICAGIGGFRSGLELAGHHCIGYIEIDKYARKSYEAMYDTNGEFTATDVTKLKSEEIPKADCWCFGFPCQDISVAGKQKGLDGERSGIFYNIINLLKGKSTKDKPEWLLIENVKNLLSVEEGGGFTEVLSEISEAGYDAEWTVLNSKDFGVPQNRERVFIVGHLRERGRRQVLSNSGTSGQTVEKIKVEPKQIIPGDQAHRVYDSEGLSVTVKAEGGGLGAKTGLYTVPKINTIATGSNQKQAVQECSGISRALTAIDYKEPQTVAIPYDEIRPMLRANKSSCTSNGRRYKENGENMFTLTASDIHGDLLAPIDNQYGIFEYEGKEYNIRRLTPRECFRLQGFTDEQFEKAQAVNSNSQLYKQAGNAVTVNVATYLGKLIA